MPVRGRQLVLAAIPCWVALAMLAATSPLRADFLVNVAAIPAAEGIRTLSPTPPFVSLMVIPVGMPASGAEILGSSVDRNGGSQTALEFSLAPLGSLAPGFTIVSATLSLNYAGGSAFGVNGLVQSPGLNVTGYRDQDGVLTLDDFDKPAAYTASRTGLQSSPFPDLVSPQSFDVTSLVLGLSLERVPFVGFRFSASGGDVSSSAFFNGFNTSDPTLRPTLTVVVAVPEPASAAMMGLGISCASGMAWRGRRLRLASGG